MTELPFSAAAERNQRPILDVLRQVLPARGRALEIASGTGQHVVWFAAGLSQWTWLPTEPRAAALQPIEARVAQEGLSNVRAPLLLDVMAPQWFDDGTLFDAIYCANMLHISPWATCAALMQGSARHLSAAGVLVTYGPYLEHDVLTSEGNLAFDQSLRARDPAWGLRQRVDVQREAQAAGLRLQQRFAMPANNLLLVWARLP